MLSYVYSRRKGARMTKSHHDKIAIVSGGANGIGQAFAQRLAQDGAHIVIADIARVAIP